MGGKVGFSSSKMNGIDKRVTNEPQRTEDTGLLSGCLGGIECANLSLFMRMTFFKVLLLCVKCGSVVSLFLDTTFVIMIHLAIVIRLEV